MQNKPVITSNIHTDIRTSSTITDVQTPCL